MSFEYEQFKRLTINFHKFEFQFHQWLRSFLLREGQRFIREVKMRTPVDTGDLRNHWQLDGITREGDNLKCWFINPMYYATYVEYGHAKPYKAGAAEGSEDWVEGYFMMTVSLDKIKRNMPARFEKSFKKFAEEMEIT